MVPTRRMRSQISFTPSRYLAILVLSHSLFVLLVDGQYEGSKQQRPYHGMSEFHSGYNYDNQAYNFDDGTNEDRPKVHLGIRLRIPAIKFELPRFNMPKITVSAKIRQPNRPRTITLPEINLDTSSKVAPPGGEPIRHHPPGPYGVGGGGYHGKAQGGAGQHYQAASSRYNQPTYEQAGGYQQQTFTGSTYSNGPDTALTFSTHQDSNVPNMQRYPVSGQGTLHYPAPSVQNHYNPQLRYHQQVDTAGGTYSASSIQPSYSMTSSGYPSNDHQDQHQPLPYNGQQTTPGDGKDTETGFNDDQVGSEAIYNKNNSDETTMSGASSARGNPDQGNYFATPTNQRKYLNQH